MNIREFESYSRCMSGSYPHMGQLRLSFKLTMVFRGLREVVAIVKEEEEDDDEEEEEEEEETSRTSGSLILSDYRYSGRST